MIEEWKREREIEREIWINLILQFSLLVVFVVLREREKHKRDKRGEKENKIKKNAAVATFYWNYWIIEEQSRYIRYFLLSLDN